MKNMTFYQKLSLLNLSSQFDNYKAMLLIQDATGISHQERSIFGFKFDTDVNSMPEAALIHPVVIANATQSDAYYYEGNFYPNLLTLRQAFLNSLKNNEHQALTSYEIKLVNATQSVTKTTSYY